MSITTILLVTLDCTLYAARSRPPRGGGEDGGGGGGVSAYAFSWVLHTHSISLVDDCCTQRVMSLIYIYMSHGSDIGAAFSSLITHSTYIQTRLLLSFYEISSLQKQSIYEYEFGWVSKYEFGWVDWQRDEIFTKLTQPNSYFETQLTQPNSYF